MRNSVHREADVPSLDHDLAKFMAKSCSKGYG